MTAPTLLAEATRLGIELSTRGDRLHVEAPAGVITPAIRAALVEHKPALLVLLRDHPPADEHASEPGPPDLLPSVSRDDLARPAEPEETLPHRLTVWNPDGDGRTAAAGRRWRCLNPFCLHKGRWWMSRWGVVLCLNCRPPAFPGLVVASGNESDAPEIKPGLSNQAIGGPWPLQMRDAASPSDAGEIAGRGVIPAESPGNILAAARSIG